MGRIECDQHQRRRKRFQHLNTPRSMFMRLWNRFSFPIWNHYPARLCHRQQLRLRRLPPRGLLSRVFAWSKQLLRNKSPSILKGECTSACQHVARASPSLESCWQASCWCLDISITAIAVQRLKQATTHQWLDRAGVRQLHLPQRSCLAQIRDHLQISREVQCPLAPFAQLRFLRAVLTMPR